jgi:hypothetical protein
MKTINVGGFDIKMRISVGFNAESDRFNIRWLEDTKGDLIRAEDICMLTHEEAQQRADRLLEAIKYAPRDREMSRRMEEFLRKKDQTK